MIEIFSGCGTPSGSMGAPKCAYCFFEHSMIPFFPSGLWAFAYLSLFSPLNTAITFVHSFQWFRHFGHSRLAAYFPATGSRLRPPWE